MKTQPERPLWAVVLVVCAASCTRDADVAVDPERPDSSSPVRAADSIAEHPEELTDLWTRRAGVDWPDFLGPRRDGTSPEKGILTEWPAAGPRIVWQRELGGGYGIGSVSRGRFFQFDRLGNRARLICMHAETGKTLWQFEYRSDYEDLYGYENGPRCSPVIDGNRVYIYGAEGWLHCLRASDGELIWKCDTAGRFGVIQNFFGVGSTPVIDGELLIAVVGGSPAEDQNVPPRQLDRV
ncbi:MAG: PQQ-like beta-propeller repeat protein, partial [Planctomycetes bacterium]|nr:PQQ-like beta-propeller repeat protein [Planctomycetota bacterium]